MATKILSAKADIALLAKLTAEANVAKQQRKLDLLIKTELLKIANAINDAANKGETEINFALSASVKKLEDLSAIETEFTEQGYTFEKAYNRSNIFTGYVIKWPSEEEVIEGDTEGQTEGVTEGQTEGVTEGETEGQTEGITEGETEGETEGQTEGITEGITEGETEGETEGITEGETEGETEGDTEGLTE